MLSFLRCWKLTMYSRCEMQICYKMQIVINLFVSSILTSFCDPICELYHQTHSTPPLPFISTLHIHLDTFFVLLSHSLSLLFIHFTTYLLYISFISFTHTHKWMYLLMYHFLSMQRLILPRQNNIVNSIKIPPRFQDWKNIQIFQAYYNKATKHSRVTEDP